MYKDEHAKCKRCGAPIIFIRSRRRGKYIPCNPGVMLYNDCEYYPEKRKDKIVTEDGETIRVQIVDDIDRCSGIGYICHFDTCTQMVR